MATNTLEGGAGPRHPEMLGYAQLDTTQIYTEVSIERLQQVHAQAHPASLERSRWAANRMRTTRGRRMIEEEDPMGTNTQSSIKEVGHQLVDELPDDATLKDLSDAAYAQYLRGLVDEGIADLDAGRVVSHEEVKARYPFP